MVSCSQLGIAQPSFIKSLMHSRTDLKLFSFGFRRIITFSAPYTTSEFPPNLITSRWYCAASSDRTRVRSLFRASGTISKEEETDPLTWSFTRSLAQRSSITSAPRTKLSPRCWSTELVESSSWSSFAVTFWPTASIKRTSFFLIWSHSLWTPARKLFRSSLTSHMTRAGLASPMLGFCTSTTTRDPDAIGRAIRAHPENFTLPVSPSI